MRLFLWETVSIRTLRAQTWRIFLQPLVLSGESTREEMQNSQYLVEYVYPSVKEMYADWVYGQKKEMLLKSEMVMVLEQKKKKNSERRTFFRRSSSFCWEKDTFRIRDKSLGRYRKSLPKEGISLYNDSDYNRKVTIQSPISIPLTLHLDVALAI